MDIITPENAPLVAALVFEEGPLSIWKQILQPGGETPWHHHKEVTDGFVVSEGCIVVDAGDASHDLLPGQHFAVPPGTPHRVRNTGTAPATFVTVQTGGTRDFVLAG